MSTRPKLRWYQYRLRTLLILMTLFAFACSWFTVKMNQAKRQRETIEAIEKLGGTVTYAYNSDNAAPMVMTTHYGPLWLRKLLGDDFFDNVGHVFLRDCRDPDAAMELVRTLPHVRSLDAVGASITDAGLAEMGEMTQLLYVNLGQTKIGDAGMEHLRNLKQIKWLCLESTNLSDEGMKPMAGFTQLEKLFLSGTRVGDTGVKNLHGLNKLRLLDLGGTRITDHSLKSIANLPQLNSIYLHDTQLTDAGMDQLKGLLPHLEAFWVTGTPMTDASLACLKDSKNLQYLGIGNGVTDAGLRQLESLPQINTLDLGKSQVTDAGLAHLKRITGLSLLILGDAKIGDEGVKDLKTVHPSLRVQR